MGLNVYEGNTKVLSVNAASKESVTQKENEIEEVETFTHLGTVSLVVQMRMLKQGERSIYIAQEHLERKRVVITLS